MLHENPAFTHGLRRADAGDPLGHDPEFLAVQRTFHGFHAHCEGFVVLMRCAGRGTAQR